MTVDRKPKSMARLRELYLAAAKLPAAEREAFLDEHCAGDESLRNELRVLLAKADGEQGTVGDLVAEAAEDLMTSIESDIKSAGAYRILRRIGEGGMGRVYLAERDDGHFKQRVAIKIVDRSRSTPDLVARFQSERQILASLDHPNIARLFDGGETDDGVPYLVMEYIDGVPVDQYCDEQRLSLAARLKLFVDVCAAVDYAHRRLIVHRDLKPSNILVTTDGVPKLLDFGIAKLLNRKSVDYTMAMTVGDVRMMTPRHASPEQIRGETITTASDIYSLGLLLYQLMTGHFPYRETGTQAYELERLICETDPLRPSAAVTQAGDAPAAQETISRARRLRSTGQLKNLLSGDLDNIILVAMRKEPERRYASVRQLSDDVGNYLSLRPVLARGDSFGYRSAKFIRRNVGTVALAGGMAAAIAVLVTVYTLRLAAERDRAELEAAKAREVTSFMTELFRGADPRLSGGEPVNVVTMLDRGAERVRDELGGQPELQASLMATIGESYQNMYELNKVREYLEGRLEGIEASLGEEHPDVLRIRYVLGLAASFQSDFDLALPLHERNYAINVERHGRRSVEAAVELHQVAFIRAKLGQLKEAEQLLLEEIDILRSLGEPQRSNLSTALLEYGTTVSALGRLEEGGVALHEAIDIQREVNGERHPLYIGILNNLANNYNARALRAQAREYMLENRRLSGEVYGLRSGPYAAATNNFAALLQAMGDLDAALPMYREVLDICADVYGKDSTRYAYALENIGGAYQDAEDYVAAEDYYRQTIDVLAARYGAEHTEVAITRSRLGGMLNAREQYAAALKELEIAAGAMSEQFGEAHRRTMYVRIASAVSLRGLGRDDDAIASLKTALAASEERPDELRLRRADSFRLLAEIAGDRGEAEASRDWYGQALGTWEAMGFLNSPSLITIDDSYARFLQEQGQTDEAIAHLESRIASFTAGLGADNSHTQQLVEWLEALR